jgi:hypothetical protein
MNHNLTKKKQDKINQKKSSLNKKRLDRYLIYKIIKIIKGLLKNVKEKH